MAPCVEEVSLDFAAQSQLIIAILNEVNKWNLVRM